MDASVPLPASAESNPVRVEVEPALTARNRLTTAFRPILALPHLLLVGGPIAFGFTISNENGTSGSFTGGVLGAVAVVIAIIAWFAIVFGSQFPAGLWSLAALYLRWRVRALAYLMLLRDEYPPFGEARYPATLMLLPREQPADRLTVAFRFILALPHILCVAVLGVAWAVTTLIAWFAILFTGKYPESLYPFGVGVLRWGTRVEAYLLLLRDEYPPFALD